MKKPFDSKVEVIRDDTVPSLEFKYAGTRMTQGEVVATALAASFVVTAPLVLWPIIRSRTKKVHIRLDAAGATVDGEHYPREHVQRVRTETWLRGNNAAAPGEVKAIVFDYGTKRKALAQRLSEPELLWIYDQVQDFMGKHWAEAIAPTRF